MSIEKIREKLDAIVSKQPSKWLDEAQWRLDNRESLELSQEIAMKILDRLEELNMSQKTLAEILNVKPQQVSKIVKGKENLTVDTITKLGHALGIKLISVNNSVAQNISVINTVIESSSFSFIAKSLLEPNKRIYDYKTIIFDTEMLSAYDNSKAQFSAVSNYLNSNRISLPKPVEYTSENDYEYLMVA